MAKLKSKTQCLVELKEGNYLMLLENSIKMETLKIAGIGKMAICKAMEHILQHQHIDLLIKSVSVYSFNWKDFDFSVLLRQDLYIFAFVVSLLIYDTLCGFLCRK